MKKKKISSPSENFTDCFFIASVLSPGHYFV